MVAILCFAGFGFWFWEVLFCLSVEFECVCLFGMWEVLSRKREKVSCIYSQPGSRPPCLYQSSDWAGLLPSWRIWNRWPLIRWHSTCSESQVCLYFCKVLSLYFSFSIHAVIPSLCISVCVCACMCACVCTATCILWMWMWWLSIGYVCFDPCGLQFSFEREPPWSASLSFSVLFVIAICYLSFTLYFMFYLRI